MLARYAHRPEDGVRLVAGADVDPRALEDFRTFCGPDVLLTSDYREILKQDDIDAVFVTSPDFLHEEQAVAALDAGKDVYLEKPMAITVEGCDRILAAAVRNKRKLYLGHNMRHMSFVLKMKELIDSGRIGEVKAGWCRHFISYGCDAYFKDWHADRTKSTSLLLQKAAHDIDVLHWLCHGHSVRVNAMGGLTVYDRISDRHSAGERGDASWHESNWPPLSQKGLNPVIDVEDISMMQMLLDNGVFASYQQCHYAPDGWRNYTIIGTEGRIENIGDAPGNCEIRLWNKRTDFNEFGDERFVIPPSEGSHGGADPMIVAEFVRYLREGGRVATSPISARHAVAAGYMAAQSLRNGGVPLSVPPLPPDVVAYFEGEECGG